MKAGGKILTGIVALVLTAAVAGKVIADFENIQAVIQQAKISVTQNEDAIYLLSPGKEVLGVKMGRFHDEMVLYAQNLPCLRQLNFDLEKCEDVPLDIYLQNFPLEEQEIIRAKIEDCFAVRREISPEKNVIYGYDDLLAKTGQNKLEKTVLRGSSVIRDLFKRTTAFVSFS